MRKRMLIIGLVWPEPRSSAAGWRMLHLLQTFLREGFELHFASAASKSEFSEDLIVIGVQEKNILLNDASFDEYVQELQPDFVLFDRFMTEEQYSWRVKSVCPDALLLLDTEDLHFLRQARQEAFKQGKELIPSQWHTDLAKREIASIYRCDLSIIISKQEMDILNHHFRIPLDLLCFLPFQFQQQQQKRDLPKFQDRQHFAFIGNFLHEPNWRTVLELKRLWPHIRTKLGKVELHIYGSYPSQKVWDLQQLATGFHIKGRADDAISTLSNYRALLAPIPFGAGQKGKFVDATFAKTPSVTTRIGAEGMGSGQQWSGFIVDGDQEFIDAAIHLYQDEPVWQAAQDRGQQLLANWEAEDQTENMLIQLLKIQFNLVHHRQLNFVGQLLWSNQFAASKYMSLWIQEKSKK